MVNNRTRATAGKLIQDSVLGVKGNQVCIGTDAPEDIQIMREELLDTGQRGNELAVLQ